jgi:hypothetical protein
VNILGFKNGLDVYSFYGLSGLVEHINKWYDRGTLVLTVRHDEVWIMKLNVFGREIQFYLGIFLNFKLMEPIGTFVLHLLLVQVLSLKIFLISLPKVFGLFYLHF